MTEKSMRGIDLDYFVTSDSRTLGCQTKRCNDTLYIGLTHGLWCGPAISIGNRRGGTGNPGRFVALILILRIYRCLPVPWPTLGRLTTGVRNLQTGYSAFRRNKIRQPLQAVNLTIVPDTQIAVRAPPVAFYRRGLRIDQRRSAQHKTAKVHQMPVVRIAIFCAVLTHWRDRNAIFKFDISQFERGEQLGHGSRVVETSKMTIERVR